MPEGTKQAEINASDAESEIQTNTTSVIEEHLRIDKNIAETGKVTVVKSSRTELEKVTLTSRTEDLKIEKVPVNRYVESVPETRQEGNITIIPVLKEVMVVEKRLLLIEEIRITKIITETSEDHVAELIKQEVQIIKN